MIDLHMHTVYSDGDKTISEILKKCEEKKLEYISITDHNTCKQYQDEALKQNIFSGKIIKGSELKAIFKNKAIEILAYDIKNTEIIEKWSQKFFSEEILRKQQEDSKKQLLDICDKKGLIYDEDKIKKDILLTDYITIYIYQELMKHKENYKILGEYTESLSYFIRKGLLNPKSEYFIKDNSPKPEYKEVIEVVHEAGALAFLAHPYEYRFQDTIEFIDDLRKEKELDGIECFHPSANENEMHILEKYARHNNLYISGGSDYHGQKKPKVEIGIGEGNLKIKKEYVEEWLKNS